MFEDKRSKRIVLVAHCVLNQNAKIDQCAHYPGAMKEIVETVLNSGAGMVQMPCPELLCLGLDRQADLSAARTVESEDDRVALRMREPDVRARCAGIARDLSALVEEYRKHGFDVVGVIGINGSPTCGVEISWANGAEIPGPGVLIEELRRTLKDSGVALRMRGVKAYEPRQALTVAKELVGSRD